MLKIFDIETSEVLHEWKTLRKDLNSHYEEPNTLKWKEINAQYYVGHTLILTVIDYLQFQVNHQSVKEASGLCMT